MSPRSLITAPLGIAYIAGVLHCVRLWLTPAAAAEPRRDEISTDAFVVEAHCFGAVAIEQKEWCATQHG